MSTPDTLIATPIREPLLRGHHSVAALWFPSDWFDEPARAARIIACWRTGATALRFAQGDLLNFATPVEENCEDLPGWPLRLDSGALCSAALRPVERALGRDGDVWIVRGAEVLTLHKRDAVPLDPSSWIAVGDLALHETYDCREPIPPAVLLDLEARPLRDVLGNAVGPESPERTSFLEALNRANQKHPERVRQLGNSRRTSPRDVNMIAGLLVGIIFVTLITLAAITSSSFPFVMLFVIVMVLRFLIAMTREGGKGIGAGNKSAPRPNGSIPARSKLAHPQRWRRWLARIAITTQLSRLMGRAHARHLRRVLDFFDDGNLEEALRHAIPLDATRGSLGQSFGMPGRRGSLELSRGYGPATTLSFGDELHEHLRNVYRQAFAKLEREGRHDEAVFVLAELLNAKQEALDYLERLGQFHKAAELALGWDMPSDVIVRLQALAGDWRRAIAVARRDNAFAGAIIQMEQRWPDAARRLREEWAKALVEQGLWLDAVEAVWPIESLRDKAAQWLLTAEAAGGGLGARSLVQRAILLPDTLERYAQRLQDLQGDRGRWRERMAMAQALMAHSLKHAGRTHVTQNLLALVAPGVLADHAQGNRLFDQKALQELVASTGDILLQADLPNGHWQALQPEPIARRASPLCLEAPEPGVLPIVDAAPLEDQRHLVALGEAGACVVDASGRIVIRFATPTNLIVMAHSRQVALLLAPREGTWRVSRLDLARKVVVDLGMIRFDFCARQFDGINWTVTQGRNLRVLDTQDSLRQVVWQVTDLPGDVCALSTSETLEQIVVASGDKQFEVWAYRLPQRQLKARDDLPVRDGVLTLINPTGGTLLVETTRHDDGSVQLLWRYAGRSPQFALPPSSPEGLAFWVYGDWMVVRAASNAGWEIRWLLLASGTESVYVLWPGDAVPNVRLHGDTWLICDDRGRLLHLEGATGAVQSFSVR